MNKFSLAVAAVAAGMLAFAGAAQADCSIDLGEHGTLDFDNPGDLNNQIQANAQIQGLAGLLGVPIGNINELHRALAGAAIPLPSTGTPIGDSAFKTGQVMQFVQSACGQGSGDPS